MKKVTLSVGIPAYNEEKNIQELLHSIFKQKSDTYVLESVFVYSDGSEDFTCQKVSEYAKIFPKITLLCSKIRKGKGFRLNQILKKNSSELLVLFDADVTLASKNVLQNLVSTVMSEKKCLLAFGNKQPLAAQNFIGKVINARENLWYELRKDINEGDSIFNCSGSISILRKELCDTLKFPKNISSDDQYLYLFAQSQGGKNIYVDTSVVYFRCPSNLRDFFIQQSRLKAEADPVLDFFADEDTRNMNNFRKNKLRIILKYLLMNPILYSGALALELVVRLLPVKNSKVLWEPASSTKEKIYHRL